jgi:hypothetical protein
MLARSARGVSPGLTAKCKRSEEAETIVQVVKTEWPVMTEVERTETLEHTEGFGKFEMLVHIERFARAETLEHIGKTGKTEFAGMMVSAVSVG